MKSIELHPVEGFDALRLVDRPSPAVGEYDVCVRVGAVSLNYRDLVVAKGAVKRKGPLVPASDGAGEVVAVGAKVSRLKVGDRVAGSFFPTWVDGVLSDTHHANALGGGRDGMLAEEVVLPETAWVKLPAGYSFEQGATLPCAGLTAWNALFESASLKAGDTVLVQGTGGVSIFALQLAKAAGARVIATSSSDEKRAKLEAMGAAATINYKTEPQWGEAARALTGGRGVDLAVEVGGAGTFDQSAKALGYGGTMSLIGVLAGTQAAINTYAIIHKNLQVKGIYVGSVAMFERFVRGLEATTVEPVVDRVFAFEETRAAYEYLASGAHFGKVVIRVG